MEMTFWLPQAGTALVRMGVIMDYDAVLAQVLALLRQEKRLAYRVLKRRFQLDDDPLEDLKDDLIYAKRLAADEEGKVLVWTGDGGVTIAPMVTLSEPAQPPDIRGGQSPKVDLPRPDLRPAEAGRRQLTVLFCDVVGSTALAGRLDPEDLREVIQAFQQTCAEVIQRFEGYIAQYLGDGLLVYFGYPQAHEDDAQRAVRTGLEMVEAIRTLNTRLERDKAIQLAIRLGIHTGVVVVGEMGGGDRREQLALGDTPNVAARIQAIAVPNTVLISAATRRLVGGFFAYEDVGSHLLKGVSQPIALHRVLQESGAQSRVEITSPGGLPPLIGREAEVALLLEHWARSKDGAGQVVFLSGEPGIGKSRLVELLREHVGSEGCPRIAFRCSPYHTNSALYPVIEHLRRRLQFHRDDMPEIKLAKLEEGLRTYRFSSEKVVLLLAALLSVPLPEGRYRPLNLSPQQQKQQTAEALTAWFVEEAVRQPVLVVYEDLHWADPSSLELLSRLIEEVPTARMLTLLTFRPEFRPPWTPRSHITQLTLTRFTRPEVESMIAQVMHSKTLPVEVIRQVMAKTDGVPLFIEELLKMILESGLLREKDGHYLLTGPLPPLAIPSTLQDSLMARLDRLAAVREIAQLGAALGREFSYEVIQAVALMDEGTLQHGLAALVDAELVYQRGRVPQATYLFKHALIRDAAYQSLLKSKRQLYHKQIAQVLEARFPEIKETQPELLAHHYTEAGLHELAVGYWQRAGQRAMQHSAHVEAISHVTRGLELLGMLPDTPERPLQELDLQTTLGLALMATKGMAAPEVGNAYARARELCQEVGGTPQLFQVLMGLCTFYRQRGEFQTARELGEQCLTLAQREGEPMRLLEAHRALGVPLFYLGELVAARAHLEQEMALYDPQQQRSHASHYGVNPRVSCLSTVIWPLWLLGYPDQALERCHDALTLAQELSHPYSLAYALQGAIRFHRFRREVQAAQERAEALLALSIEQGFAQWEAAGAMIRGWGLAEQGQEDEGIAQIRQGLAAWQGMGIEAGQPYWLALLADAHTRIGQVEEGLHVLAEAFVLVDKNGERWWEAELHRLKGELLLGQSGPDEHQAEAYFHQALNIAHRQQAKSLALRAAMSLSRLWQQQGKPAEARQLLAEIYGWFTEGFDTADLQEAKAMLEELS
jgi:TOMM system kinase/cyclase fusion protein